MAKRVNNTKIKAPITNTIPGGKINNFLDSFSQKITNYKKSKKIYIIAIIAGLLLLGIYKKEWFVAATINGSPITNLELQIRLNEQFRSKTLDQLITEKIILDEAKKNKSLPTESEISKGYVDLEVRVGGKEALNAILAQQGQTRNSIRSQVLLPLAITKLYEKEATVSAEEITKFIEENKEQLQATDSASQEKEAYDALKNQKLTQIFSQKFQELKTKAKIQIF